MSEPAWLEQAAQDMRRLESLRVDLNLDGLAAFQLMAALQLACRHPRFSGPTRAGVERLARDLQAQVGLTPALRALAEAGWHPDQDQEVDR